MVNNTTPFNLKAKYNPSLASATFILVHTHKDRVKYMTFQICKTFFKLLLIVSLTLWKLVYTNINVAVRKTMIPLACLYPAKEKLNKTLLNFSDAWNQ